MSDEDKFNNGSLVPAAHRDLVASLGSVSPLVTRGLTDLAKTDWIQGIGLLSDAEVGRLIDLDSLFPNLQKHLRAFAVRVLIRVLKAHGQDPAKCLASLLKIRKCPMS